MPVSKKWLARQLRRIRALEDTENRRASQVIHPAEEGVIFIEWSSRPYPFALRVELPRHPDPSVLRDLAYAAAIEKALGLVRGE